jgi:hypothetical protein
MKKNTINKLNRTGFTFYKSYADIFSMLENNEQKIKFIEAILEHQLTDINIDEISFNDNLLNIVWQGIKPNLHNNKQKYLNGVKGAESGVKGGRPKTPKPLNP